MGKELKRCSTATVAESSYHKDKKPLQIADTELQSSDTDVKKQKKRKKSKQIDDKDTEPLQIAESELQSSETNVKKRKKKSKGKKIDEEEEDLEPKKTSEIKEMKKLRKSFNEMTETMKNLQDFFMTKADLPGISMKDLLLTTAPNTSSKVEEEEAPKELATYDECCFKTEDADGLNKYSVFVWGFDTSLPRDEIKSALRKHFESGGLEVTRVFVPIECQTGVPLRFAFIDVDDNQKAVKYGGGYLGDGWFLVTLAAGKRECNVFPNFKGCAHCGTYLYERRAKRFMATRPWR